MKHVFRTLAVLTLAASASVVASPAHAATWHPTMVPVSTSLAPEARADYASVCANQPAHPSMTKEGSWVTAFCNPRYARLNPAAGRLGWCYRWASQAPARISITCLQDVEYGAAVGH